MVTLYFPQIIGSSFGFLKYNGNKLITIHTSFLSSQITKIDPFFIPCNFKESKSIYMLSFGKYHTILTLQINI